MAVPKSQNLGILRVNPNWSKEINNGPKVWYDAKGVKNDIASSKWLPIQTDPKFPQGVRFSNKMTRWSSDSLDEYDRQKAGMAADD